MGTYPSLIAISNTSMVFDNHTTWKYIFRWNGIKISTMDNVESVIKKLFEGYICIH
jgi:hypothetical protein